MDILQIIRKKRDNKKLSKEEIEYFVYEYTNANIEDYQIAALMMAIYINGMDDEEITNLTIAMSNSGQIVDLSSVKGIIVDKHSTGGVGDKVSLILLPIVSSLGVSIAKMSGRGLGFTGGTADKLEAIPGYKTDISINEFKENINDIGISIITQTDNIAPADKKMYQLRNSIACVENIPLIASSIMSKKIASGAKKLVLDVTVGNGAFLKNIEDSKLLAEKMVEIGKRSGLETIVVLTNMNQHLGYAIGNILEVIESIEFLKGNMPDDLKEVILELGANMMKLANISDDLVENKNKILENINNGKALEKLIELVEKQKGDISYIKDTNKFKKAKYIIPIKSSQKGIVKSINAQNLGECSRNIGAGRIEKNDKILHEVGLIINIKIGDILVKDQVIGHLHINDEKKIEESMETVQNSILIVNQDDEKVKKIEDILGIIA